MSDFENPYNSPESPIVPEKTQNAGNLTVTMLQYLKEASPWLQFVGILGFIGCGLMVLFGIIFAFLPNVIAGSFMDISGSGPFWIFSLFYAALAALFFFPASFTYNFGAKIRKYQYSNSDEDLEQAFRNNKSFWKFYGILCIVYLAFIPVIIVIAIIVGVAATAGLF
jgi:uncharacterized protein involved in cysteine biosynthesis